MNLTAAAPNDWLSRTQIKKVLAEFPQLTAAGFLSPRDPDFSKYRRNLLHEESLGQFEQASAFLFDCRKTVRISTRRTSYCLKHCAEKFARAAGAGGADVYVSNGAFIAAAIADGFQIKRIPNSPNVFLNISVPRRRNANRRADPGFPALDGLRCEPAVAAWHSNVIPFPRRGV